MLAHVPSFGRNPRVSPEFLAYPVPKACMHVLGTGVPRCFGVARSASSPKAAQALGCSLTPGLRIAFGLVTCMARAAPVPGLWTLGFLLLRGACVLVWVVVGFGFWLRPITPGWGVGLCVRLCVRSACTLPLLAGVCGVGVCAWVQVPAAPRHSWLGCRGLCLLLCALRLHPATPGWGVRRWCVCFSSGLGCAPPLLAGVLGCVCACVCAPLVPCHSWLGCAVWVCVLGFRFRLRPATPGWGVGVCVCLCARSACTPPLLAGVCGVGVCASARVSAAPRHSWLGCWAVCVLVYALCLHPTTPGWGVRCRCVCLGSGFGCSPPLLAGLLGCVCARVRAPLAPSTPGNARCGSVFGLGFRLRPATPGLGVWVCVCWCAEGAVTKGQEAGMSTHGYRYTGWAVCVVCALCVSVLLHCRTSALPQCTASLPWGSGQWTSCDTLPHCPGGSGQCNSYNALSHCPGAVGSATPAMCCLTALGAVGSATAAMYCLTALGAVGSATPAMHCPTAWGQWAVQLLQCTAPLPGGSGQCNSCNALPHCLRQWTVQLLQCTAPLPGGSGQCNSCNVLPHCLGAADTATPAMHCLTALGQWAVQPLQCTASLPGGSGQRNSCNALPHCLGAVDSATPAMHCPTAWGQWAVQLLQSTAALPWGSRPCNLCNALPQCLGAVGRATPAMHRLTAWGQWAVQLLQCTASLP